MKDESQVEVIHGGEANVKTRLRRVESRLDLAVVTGSDNSVKTRLRRVER